MSMKDMLRYFGLSRPAPTSASAAKDRLSFILMQEHAHADAPDFLPRLKDDILAVIRKYVPITDDAIQIQANEADNMRGFTVSIDLPTHTNEGVSEE